MRAHASAFATAIALGISRRAALMARRTATVWRVSRWGEIRPSGRTARGAGGEGRAGRKGGQDQAEGTGPWGGSRAGRRGGSVSHYALQDRPPPCSYPPRSSAATIEPSAAFALALMAAALTLMRVRYLGARVGWVGGGAPEGGGVGQDARTMLPS